MKIFLAPSPESVNLGGSAAIKIEERVPVHSIRVDTQVLAFAGAKDDSNRSWSGLDANIQQYVVNLAERAAFNEALAEIGRLRAPDAIDKAVSELIRNMPRQQEVKDYKRVIDSIFALARRVRIDAPMLNEKAIWGAPHKFQEDLIDHALQNLSTIPNDFKAQFDRWKMYCYIARAQPQTADRTIVYDTRARILDRLESEPDETGFYSALSIIADAVHAEDGQVGHANLRDRVARITNESKRARSLIILSSRLPQQDAWTAHADMLAITSDLVQPQQRILPLLSLKHNLPIERYELSDTYYRSPDACRAANRRIDELHLADGELSYAEATIMKFQVELDRITQILNH